MIYLASPYSHKDPDVMETRYRAAMDATAWLLARKKWVYSPIVHCHELAKMHELPKDFNFWEHYNKHMLSRSNSMYVLAIAGWAESVGVAAELAFAEMLGMERGLLKKHIDGYVLELLYMQSV